MKPLANWVHTATDFVALGLALSPEATLPLINYWNLSVYTLFIFSVIARILPSAEGL